MLAGACPRIRAEPPVNGEDGVDRIGFRGQSRRPGQRRGTEPRRESRVPEHGRQRIRQGARVFRRYQEGSLVTGQVRDSADAGRYQRPARLQGFLNDQRLAFPSARHRHNVRHGQQHLDVVSLAEEPHRQSRGVRLPGQNAAQRTFSRDHQQRGAAGSPARS